MKTRILLAFIFSMIFGISSADDTQFINFNDGTDLIAIEDFYSSAGLIIQNGIWASNAGGLAGASPPLGLQALVSGTAFTSVFNEDNAIIGIFSRPVSRVSIIASDVGFAGAEIKVYDATEGGSLLGSDTLNGTGSGVSNFGIIQVSASGIRRFELFQPVANPESSDGLGFDDLSFDITEAPSAAQVPFPIWANILLGLVLISISVRLFKISR